MKAWEAVAVFSLGCLAGALLVLIVKNWVTSSTALNKETWTWIDWQGRERTLKVYREAK